MVNPSLVLVKEIIWLIDSFWTFFPKELLTKKEFKLAGRLLKHLLKNSSVV
jgi:hypothetical protein